MGKLGSWSQLFTNQRFYHNISTACRFLLNYKSQLFNYQASLQADTEESMADCDAQCYYNAETMQLKYKSEIEIQDKKCNQGHELLFY